MAGGSSVGSVNGCPRPCYNEGEKGLVWHCRFHPTKAKLACALDNGRVCVFYGRTPSAPFSEWEKLLFFTESNSLVLSIDWNVDGTKLAAGCKDGTVVVWAEDGHKFFETKRCDYAITYVSCEDGTVVVVQNDDEKPQEQKGHEATVRCLRWNHRAGSTHLLATGSDDKTIIVWDSTVREGVAGDVINHFKFHGGWIWDLRWISANILASAADDFTIKICRVGRDAPLHTLTHHQFHWVYALRWNEPEAQLASCSHDGSIKIWSVDKSEPSMELRESGSPVNCIDWFWSEANGSPKKSLIASGSEDFSVSVWDMFDEQPAPAPKPAAPPAAAAPGAPPAPTGPVIIPKVLKGHCDKINSVAFSPDGKFLASVDNKGTVIIWSMQDWSLVFETNTVPSTFWDRLSWDVTGRKLAVANRSPEVTVVELK